MQLAPKLNIHGHWYSVRIVPDNKVPGGGVGHCSWPDRVIHVASTLSGLELLYTVLHEARHGYQFESGFAFQVLDEQAMEIDAESFASLTTSLFAQLMEKDQKAVLRMIESLFMNPPVRAA